MTNTITKHFVTFYSPGTMVAETDAKPIDSWDINAAVKMARSIKQRYGATPYGFRFTTRMRGPGDFDSKETDRSPVYWLGGKIETLAEVEARNDPNESILRSNMRDNGWDKVITNCNSYKWTQPFEEGKDVLLDVDMQAETNAI